MDIIKEALAGAIKKAEKVITEQDGRVRACQFRLKELADITGELSKEKGCHDELLKAHGIVIFCNDLLKTISQ